MNNKWLTEAISNNADWCTAVATSFDIPIHRDESIWASEHPMPPFYPNIITLKSGSCVDDAIDSISAKLPSGWGIKDSYCELNLENKGFSCAFRSNWYCRLPGNNDVTGHLNPKYQLKKVKSHSELNQWIAAWGESDEVFNTSLLNNKSVEFVYLKHNNEIVSGLAINISGDSVGISNTFGSPDALVHCVALVSEMYPAKGIVGYGDKAEFEILSKIGFQEIGELQVWLHD